jgi:rubrerythrin
MGWEGLRAAGPAQMGMVNFTGEEDPEGIALIAFGMEEMLAAFYTEMARTRGDGELVELFSTLAKVEEVHQDRVFELYLAAAKESLTREEFEARAAPQLLEGGFTTGEFLAANEEALKDVEGALNIAMMLEAQALDLYMRFSQKAKSQETREMLLSIAEDEKKHLGHLGDLLNEKA